MSLILRKSFERMREKAFTRRLLFSFVFSICPHLRCPSKISHNRAKLTNCPVWYAPTEFGLMASFNCHHDSEFWQVPTKSKPTERNRKSGQLLLVVRPCLQTAIIRQRQSAQILHNRSVYISTFPFLMLQKNGFPSISIASWRGYLFKQGVDIIMM